VLDHVAGSGLRVLEGADVEHLPRVVPVVDGLVNVDPLVTLQANQARSCHIGEHLGELGLSYSRLPLEEQRLTELVRDK
jgi:hypothetical protein